MTVILLLTVLAVVIGYVCYEWLSRVFFSALPPSPFALPILGHPFHMLFTNHATSTRMSNRFGGKSYVLRVLNKRFLFLTTCADMKEAVVNQADVFSSKFGADHGSNLSLGRITFLFLDGPVWKEKRRFTLHHLRNFGFGRKLMENTILEEFDRVCEVLDQRQTMSFANFFFCPFLNVLWGILASKTYEFGDEELKRVSQLIRVTFALGKKGVMLGMIPWLKYVPGDLFSFEERERCIAGVKDFIEKQIDEHERTLVDGEPRDYIDAYLIEIKKHQGTEFTAETECYQRSHLLGAIYDILQAGVETTATTLEWSLLYMATWPEIQQKVQHELDTVVGCSRRTAYADSAMLPYTRAVLSEVQRFCTVVPLCSPRVTTRTTKLNGYTIPRGTLVLQNLYAVHNEKRVWGDPENFRPERFLGGEDGKADKFDGLIPFSLGPRTCLGESLARMELFLYFTGFLQKYSFRIRTGHTPPSLIAVNSLTLQPQPFQLAINKRHK